MVGQVLQQRGQVAARRLCVPVDAQVGGDERADEPAPDRALVVGAVALAPVAAILADVGRIVGREGAQPVGGQQVAGASVNDRALPLGCQRGIGQGDGEQLVRPQAAIGTAIGRVEHVVAVAERVVPEAVEASRRSRRQFGVARPVRAQHRGERLHDAERVVPQGIDLHRLANARRHHPVIDLGVHPRQLHARFAAVEKPIGRVQVDVVARAPNVPVDDFGQHRVQIAQQRFVPGRLKVGVDGDEVP